MLRYFHRRTASTRLIQVCQHSEEEGTFTIALAVALREHGLTVDFYSDPDPAPHSIEQCYYRRAKELGVRMHAGADLGDILAQVGPKRLAIVLYNTEEDTGHLSPIAPYTEGRVHLPYAENSENEIMSEEAFLRCWTAPEIYRQCLLVEREQNSNSSRR